MVTSIDLSRRKTMKRSMTHRSSSNRRCECTNTRRNYDATRFFRSIATLQILAIPSRFIHTAASPSAFVSSSLSSSRNIPSNINARLFSSRPSLVDSPFSSAFEQPKIERFTKSNVLVQIERTSRNERRISGEMILNHNPALSHFDVPQDGTACTAVGLDDLWCILTDYNNLSTHVPNLVESRIISHHATNTPHPRHFDRREHSSGKIMHAIPGPRVYQRGSQRIWGFEFGADVTLDMKEIVVDYTQDTMSDSSSELMLPTTTKKFILDFKCVTSQFFSTFDGSWIVEESSTVYNPDHPHPAGGTTTRVKYVVDVRPRGPVPVAALEWRIKEDVPTNILGVANAAEKMARTRHAKKEAGMVSTNTSQARGYHPPRARASSDFRGVKLETNHNPIIHAQNGLGTEWYKDETMAMYL